MTNRKTTKKALLGSLLALVLCFAMLMGTTFAWFTDNEVLSDNKITAGTLDIKAGTTTAFKSNSLWEPGYSEPFAATLENVGSLYLKYEVSFANLKCGETNDNTEFTGLPSNITEVLEVYHGTVADDIKPANFLGTIADLNDAGTFGNQVGVTGILAPGAAANLNLIVKMIEDAGNEYQGDWCEFDIVVNATQYTFEKDGFGNDQYDADAEYAVAVQNEAELAAALGNGQNVIVTKDIAVINDLTVTGDVIIDLEGNVNASLNAARPFILEDGATLTINAGEKDVAVGKYGLVNIPNDGNVYLNGGNYTANTDNGAFVKIRSKDANEKVKVVMNGVNYVDQANNGYIVNVDKTECDIELIVNGGNFTAFRGFQGIDKTTIKNATINTTGVAVEINVGNAVIDNVTININAATMPQGEAPVAFVGVSNMGYAKVTNSTFNGAVEACYAVYTKGGKIDASNNVEPAGQVVANVWGTAPAVITVDGDVLVNQ